MMGSGKSQTGTSSSKNDQLTRIDTDDVIEKASKQTISSIFEKTEKKYLEMLKKFYKKLVNIILL